MLAVRPALVPYAKIAYTVHMNMHMHLSVSTAPAVFTATELRKTLFQQLDKAAKGQPVLFTYKGAHLQISLAPGTITGSKLARLIHREGLLCNPDDIIKTDPGLLQQWNTKWAADAARDFVDMEDPGTEGKAGE